MTSTVIVVTLNRPACVDRCLSCLIAQYRSCDQIIVVDASADTLTRDVVAKFEGVLYLRNENGFGRMTASRNIGLLHATGDIIAFVDDDAYAEPQWLVELIKTYEEGGASVGAVGGRVIGDGTDAAAGIGVIRANGTIAGNFGADPGRTIEVDHVMGCNMSFRREVLAKLGGFREDYPGISGVREDTDMLLRVRGAGYKVLFNPRAVVEHVAAPQARGRRFDWRYRYFTIHNHLVLLRRHYGWGRRLLLYLMHEAADTAWQVCRNTVAAVVGPIVFGAGTVVGTIRALKYKRGLPCRTDVRAEAIRTALKANHGGGS
jgi:GT2 family glycosyltransferase